VFDALQLLVENAGLLVEQSAIRERLWPGQIVEDGTLSKVIAELRKALGDVGDERQFIETVPKFGYRFTAIVEAVDVLPPEVIPPVAIPWRGSTNGRSNGRVRRSRKRRTRSFSV
jgi:DNA-binding winged helix-turn-helix (wHTH) protein